MICYICNKQEVSLQCPLCKRYVCSIHTKLNFIYTNPEVKFWWTPGGVDVKKYPYLCRSCANEVTQCNFCLDTATQCCEECGKKFCSKHGRGNRCYQHALDGCFIVTACMAAKGLSDNCFELNTLRSFRDMYVKNLPEGEQLISEYYAIAPRILERINQTEHPKDIYLGIYERLVLKSLKLIQGGEKDKAFKNIVSIVNDLKQNYL